MSLALMVLTSCEKLMEYRRLQGVGQGNGMITYFSDLFGYVLKYDDRLSLNESTGGDVRIDNSDLVSEEEKISFIEVRVIDAEFSDDTKPQILGDLEKYLREEYSDAEWQTSEIGGAEGFFAEEKDGDELKRTYFFLTTEKHVVKITVEIREEGSGTNLVGPVVETFAYDVTPPEILELKVVNPKPEAGKPLTVFFRAKDDISGIDPEGKMCVSFRYSSERFELVDVDLCGDPVSQGDDWYSIRDELNQYIPAGRYYLSIISVGDVAGNGSFLLADTEEGFYINRYDGSYTDLRDPISLLEIRIFNPGPYDTTDPVVQGLRIDQSEVEAGQEFTLIVTATDDVSGVAWRPSRFHGDFRSREKHFRHAGITICKITDYLGDDQYAVPVQTSRFLSAGRYELTTFILRDNAGNDTWGHLDWEEEPHYYSYTNDDGLNKLAGVSIDVVNNGPSDLVVPEVHEFRIDKSEIRAGASFDLRFRVTDNLSGVETRRHLIPSWFRPRFEPVSREFGGVFFYKDWTWHGFEHEGEGWYSTRIETNSYMPSGRYRLTAFAISDRAGSALRLHASRKDKTYRTNASEYPHYDKEDTDIPVVEIEIVR